MPTRGQVKRALAWERWLAAKPRERKTLGFPKCLTCGAEATYTLAKGQPGYGCHHEPMRIDDETMRRGRETFGA